MPALPPAVRRWWPAAAGLLALTLALVVPLSSGTDPSPAPASASGPVEAAAAGTDDRGATTELPESPTAPPAPAVAAVSAAGPPTPGAAELLDGPFNERLALRQVTLGVGAEASVSGTFAQVVENSPLLVMEVQADFYDASGAVLGSRRKVLRQPDIKAAALRPDGSDPRYGGDVPFTVQAPDDYAGRVASAFVSVPTLVNE